jgi:hypothetical protein
MNKLNIYTEWENLAPAKTINSYNLKQIKQTNLWIYKNHLNCFGFLITDTFSQLQYEYKNIVVNWKVQLVDSTSGNKLSNCLIIESKNNIDSRLFCSSLSSIFEVDLKHKFNVNEIEIALSKIEAITLKENDEFYEVIGVWGELFLLNEFILASSSTESKQLIISAWEGLNTRTKIDFNFKTKNKKIEVKTTSETTRMHHFNSLDQISTNDEIEGYLASFCITQIDSGLSCFDFVQSAKNNLPEILIPLFDEKLKIRGKVCFNDKYQFQINQYKNWEFFRFNNVPQPIIEFDITSIEWEANLENRENLNYQEKQNLIKSIID